MRIAVYHNQPAGGARRALNGFCTVLARRHSLDVFTLSTADHSMLNDHAFGGSVTTLEYEPTQAIRRGFLLNDLRQSQDLKRLDAVNREAARLIDAGSYDVALVDTCRFTFAPQLLSHLETPSVYYCHHGPWRTDGISEIQARSPYENARHLAHLPLRRRYEAGIRRQDRRLTRRANAVATNSEYSRKRLSETCDVQAEKCPPGISIPQLQPRPVSGYVLSVGDLVPHKGHDIVVRALGRLPADNRPDLHIVANTAGRTYGTRLRLLAREIGVNLLVRVGISDAELEREYGGAHLFAFGARREPLGLAPLEAMARSVAVVAVGEGGVLETIADGVTGFLVAADPHAMGDRIAQLMSDEGLRQAMGNAGRLAVEEGWSWDRRAVALEEVLARVANSRVLVPA
jgi:glycosyltransferase involved in cell wall biosynthesis